MSSLSAQSIAVAAIFILSLIHPAAQAQRVAPIPLDPHELATGPANVVETPAEQADMMKLLGRAGRNFDIRTGDGVTMKFEFTVRGSAFPGAGEITEIWTAAHSLRWTARLGDYTQSRLYANGHTFEEHPGLAAPMRVHMLYLAMLWPIQFVSESWPVRITEADDNGKKVVCLLIGPRRRGPTIPSGLPRAWEEREYCIEKDTGLLRVFSEVPGSYVIYGYGEKRNFHGRTVPDEISIFMGGSSAVTARFSISDIVPGAEKPAASGPPSDKMSLAMEYPTMYEMDAPGNSTSNEIQTVIVHVAADPRGLLEEELVVATDPALGERALQIVKDSRFKAGESRQRDSYIEVRFNPAKEKEPASGYRELYE